MKQSRRAFLMESAISELMQELIQEDHPKIGPIAIAFQTLRSKPELLARLHKKLEE